MLVQRFNRQDAKTLLGHVLDEGRIIYGKHFRDALADEGLEIADAFAVLKAGQIYDEPEPNVKTGEWKYRIEGKTPDEKQIGIVFCFKSEEDAFLITVFGLRK